jgi:TRAP-type C4-dicarboxylate transport system substrate-binding protein
MTVEELFIKAVHNKAFWDELQKDPAKALKQAGAEINNRQLDTLKKLDYKALEAVAEAFAGDRFIT